LKREKMDLIINTPSGKATKVDETQIRSLAVSRGIPCVTTIPGADALAAGIYALRSKGFEVCSVQEWHKKIKASSSQPRKPRRRAVAHK